MSLLLTFDKFFFSGCCCCWLSHLRSVQSGSMRGLCMRVYANDDNEKVFGKYLRTNWPFNRKIGEWMEFNRYKICIYKHGIRRSVLCMMSQHFGNAVFLPSLSLSLMSSIHWIHQVYFGGNFIITQFDGRLFHSVFLSCVGFFVLLFILSHTLFCCRPFQVMSFATPFTPRMLPMAEPLQWLPPEAATKRDRNKVARNWVRMWKVILLPLPPPLYCPNNFHIE